MKALFLKINNVVRHFNVFDVGILKLCLFSFGVIFGVYFFSFFNGIKFVLWIVFALTWLYIVIKTFGFYWDKEDQIFDSTKNRQTQVDGSVGFNLLR